MDYYVSPALVGGKHLALLGFPTGVCICVSVCSHFACMIKKKVFMLGFFGLDLYAFLFGKLHQKGTQIHSLDNLPS